MTVGAAVGPVEGIAVGMTVGRKLGAAVGPVEGTAVGMTVGGKLGATVGVTEGIFVGAKVGKAVGAAVGRKVGPGVGAALGAAANVTEPKNARFPKLAVQTGSAPQPAEPPVFRVAPPPEVVVTEDDAGVSR